MVSSDPTLKTHVHQLVFTLAMKVAPASALIATTADDVTVVSQSRSRIRRHPEAAKQRPYLISVVGAWKRDGDNGIIALNILHAGASTTHTHGNISVGNMQSSPTLPQIAILHLLVLTDAQALLNCMWVTEINRKTEASHCSSFLTLRLPGLHRSD